jgi:feruloyl esterase
MFADPQSSAPRASFALLTLGAALLTVASVAPAAAATCESLLTLTLPNAVVTSAATVPAGSFTAPDGASYAAVPSFCNVTLTATPTSDSAINIFVWMPRPGWNGRFEGTGNGGYAGNIAIAAPAMVYAVKHGFAVAATDMGTAPSANNNADVLVGHPQKWIDWGWRATHLMTVLAKDVMRAFYGRGPRHSYFNGCSTGGQQALMLAQRFPHHYDGILAGAPAHDRTHAHTGILWIYDRSHRTPASLIPPDKVSLITSSVLKACVRKSGGVASDGFLTDPRKCDWQPSEIQCGSPSDSNCLPPEQVRTARAIYAGPRDPVTGKRIFPGTAKGSEAASSFGWNATQSGAEPSFGSIFKWTFGLQWRYDQFDYRRSMRDMDALLARILNANNPDLSRFRARGGKLLIYHGAADPLIAPQTSIDYYRAMVTTEGNGRFTAAALRRTQRYARLFMVPGMNHCYGGPGPHVFGNEYSGTIAIHEPPQDDAGHHALLALVRWVERGAAPERIVATKFVNDQLGQGIAMQRPLCPFPEWPRYRGSGSRNDAANFTCAEPNAADAAEMANAQ